MNTIANRCIYIIGTVLLLSLAVIASEAQGLVPGTSGWACSGAVRLGLATHSGSSDGYDANDVPATYAPYGWLAGSYRVNGLDSWDADTGFYDHDFRATLWVGETKSWEVYVWAIPGITTGNLWSAWHRVYASYETDPNVTARLEYIQRPAGVTGGPEVGTVWTTPPASLTLPYYATDDPLTSHAFRFTLTLVPEPAPLIALATGLLGLAGWRARRRG